MPEAGPPKALPLTRWSGEFIDPELEAAFQADAWPAHSRQLRVVALLAGAVYGAALYLNWKGFGQGAAFRTMLALRLGTALLFAVMAWASRPGWRPRPVHALFLLIVLAMVGTRLVENQLLGPRPPAHAPSAVAIIPVMPLVAFAIIAVPLRLALVWSGAGSVLFLRGQAELWGLESPVTQLALLYLVLANGVGIAFRLAWNRISRRDFALRRELQREVAERQQAEAEARRASAAKSRFLAIMSHEIRTPLNGVLGGVQLLEAAPVHPEQAGPLEILQRSGEQLGRLLNDVLDLARVEAGRLELHAEPFDPVDLLQTVRAVVQPEAARKGLDLRLQLPDAAPPLCGDSVRLRQVLINLASNAVKFTERGEVFLALAVEPAEHAAFRCRFLVRDTGPGMDAEARRHLFEPFAKHARPQPGGSAGAGLGLTISRELVAALGGELRLDEAAGAGSCFRFELVLARAGSAPEPLAPEPPGPPRRVLVVDDLEANRVVAVGLLRALGHQALEANSAAAALALLRQGGLDAVITDLQLPDLDGRALVRAVRALPDPLTARVPVFLSSADAEASSLQAVRQARMQGVLPKPVQRDQLARLLRTLPAPPPLLDPARAAILRGDLGEVVWARAVAACRGSMEASLAELPQPDRAGPALHRLKGLAASYGMAALQERIAALERDDRSASWIEDLKVLARASHAALEARPGLPWSHGASFRPARPPARLAEDPGAGG